MSRDALSAAIKAAISHFESEPRWVTDEDGAHYERAAWGVARRHAKALRVLLLSSTQIWVKGESASKKEDGP